MSSQGRRRFIKQGLAGLSGAALLPSMLQSDNQTDTKPQAKQPFLTRVLGRTGLELPIVSMGVMNADNPNLVRRALDSGLKMLDTAHGYQRGRNEEMVGQVLSERKRDEVILATKVVGGHEKRKPGTRERIFTGEADLERFSADFETSLKRLQTDYVDILYLHNVASAEATRFEPLISLMLKWKKAGKARFIGVTTHSNEPEVLRTAADMKVIDVVLTAVNFRQDHRREVLAAIDYAAGKGLGIVAMKTQAGVYWDKERQHPINMKAALKWALQYENIHTAIPGFTTFDQLELDIEAMHEFVLTPAEKMDLDLESHKNLAGLYCNQCGRCTSQCRRHMDIPTLMRSYMYAYGYRNLALAADCLAEAGPVRCSDCTACTVACPSHFDVRERVLDIARLNQVPVEFLG